MSIQITAEDLGPTLAEEGTAAHRQEVERLADAVRGFAPGAAAALSDWAGTEISRLRAWAVARAALLERIADAQAEAQAVAAGRGAFRLIA
ncbi:hypothetical protein [Demequina rhizosphaerae]|uniref:hypothetical protein n=1 Tax=Demequina rhizosphaerae TaxID=1638985 RepID=UPI000784D5EB|nr:hypothetical protein [Demequina rhizosphaerae]